MIGIQCNSQFTDVVLTAVILIYYSQLHIQVNYEVINKLQLSVVFLQIFLERIVIEIIFKITQVTLLGMLS